MKARIVKTAPELVLTYGIDGETASALSAVLQELFLEERKVLPEEGGQSIGCLAGYEGFRKTETTEEIPESGGVLCLSGLSSARIDTLLKALREARIGVPLKAVVTPINQRWSFAKLVGELERERAEIARQTKARERRPD